MIRPGRGAALASCASWPAFLLVELVYLCLWSAGIVGLVMWDETAYVQWPQSRIPTTGPTTIPTPSGPMIAWTNPGTPQIRTRGLADVWARWHVHGPIGDAEAIFTALVFGGLAGGLFLAWLHLATVHRTGPWWASLGRAWRGGGAKWGVVLLATAALGIAIVTFNHYIMRRSFVGGVGPGPQVAFVLSFPLTGLLLAIWLGRAMRGVARLGLDPDLPPMCEGCGYNLTHVPGDGLCPECGLDAQNSLQPAKGRSGWAWESAHGWERVRAWFEVNREVLLAPSGFYRRVTVKSDPAAAARFATLHFAVMGVLTAVWAIVIVLADQQPLEAIADAAPGIATFLFVAWLGACCAVMMSGVGVLVAFLLATALTVAGLVALALPFFGTDQDYELPGVAGMALFGIPLLAWSVHRLAGAVAASWWFWRGELADPRAARKVIAYESAFIWVPWMYGLGLTSSFNIYGDWLADLVGRQWIAGFPLDVLIVMIGMGAIIAFWVHRYYLAGRAVRWANH